MSWQASQAVRDNSKLKGQARLMLVTIASYCNQYGNMDGARFTPSVETLSSGAGMTKPTGIKFISACVESGELSMREEGNGRGSRRFYTINLPMPTHDESPEMMPKNEPAEGGNQHLKSLELTVKNLTLMVKELTETIKNQQINGKINGKNLENNGKEKGKELEINGKEFNFNGKENERKGKACFTRNEVTSSDDSNECVSKRTRDTQTPSSYVAFDAMWGDGTPPDPNLLDFRQKIKKICRNGHKVDQVDDLYYLAVGYDISADDLVRWFGPGSDYWYKVSSIGKNDGLPPYVKNIDGEMKGAQMWEQAGPKMPALNGVSKEPVKILKPVKTGLRL